VSGGAGNDTITGGTGDDLLLGGDGNDAVSGGAGHDVLVGGIGSDRLIGGAGHDVLISGSVSGSVSLGALRVVGADWVASRATTCEEEETVDELVSGTDGDWLTGSAGSDWFIINVDDIITDLHEGLSRGGQGDVVTYVS
jgi:Ca2+-binding RTX toxin-like protein